MNRMPSISRRTMLKLSGQWLPIRQASLLQTECQTVIFSAC